MYGGARTSDHIPMRALLLLCLGGLVAAQPARVREATPVRQNPDGEVIGSLTAGDETTVRSRITTETGSWCRVAGSVNGSVPCKALLISPPEPVRVAQAAAPAAPASRVAAKPARTPPPAPVGEFVIEHPTANQIRRAFPGHGDVRPTQETTPKSSVVQLYKFADDEDISVAIWVRPVGDTAPTGDPELVKKLSAPPPGRTRPHLLPGGRRARYSAGQGDFTVTGLSPDGDFEWTMVYTTPENPDDVASYVLTAATALDRILFGSR